MTIRDLSFKCLSAMVNFSDDGMLNGFQGQPNDPLESIVLIVGKQTSVPMQCQWILKRRLLDWFPMVVTNWPIDPLGNLSKNVLADFFR